MNVARWAIVILGCFLFFGVGFKSGQIVEAGGLSPGSVGDPLAAKSYVEKAVAEKTAHYQEQIALLQSKLNTLQMSVQKLEAISSQTVVQATPAATANTAANPVKPTATAKPISSMITTHKKAIITAASANVRSGPGTTFSKVAGLIKGKEVKVIKEANGWVYVDIGGNVKGWLSQNLVELK